MTIASYSELVTELGEWLNRSDLSARVPTFIRLFEARMNRRLRSPDMERTFSFTTVSGTVSYALAEGVRELREVYIDTTSTDIPSSYKVRTGDIIFNEDPGSGLTVYYTGYVTLTGLDDGNTTNWLLDDHPDMYLYGSLAEAYAYLRDDQAAGEYKALSDEVLAEIVKEANSKRLPAGPLVMQRGKSRYTLVSSQFADDDPGDLAGLLE